MANGPACPHAPYRIGFGEIPIREVSDICLPAFLASFLRDCGRNLRTEVLIFAATGKSPSSANLVEERRV